MSQAGSWIAFCLLLIGCTPGYMVRLDASGFRQLDPALADDCYEVLVKALGRDTVTVERRRDSRPVFQ
jgi:hypothetical protein